MIAIDQLTDVQFERHALDVLLRELGPSGLARFLRLNRCGPVTIRVTVENGKRV